MNNFEIVDNQGNKSLQGATSKVVPVTLSQIPDRALIFHFKIRLSEGVGINDTDRMADLPVVNYTSNTCNVDQLSLKIGIFGDMSFITGKRLNKISLTIAENEKYSESDLFIDWHNKSTPDNGYVGYVEDTVKKLEYLAYSPKGELMYKQSYYVILADNIPVERSTEANELYKFTCNMTVVGIYNP